MELDGAAGGGQLLRSALTLAMCTGQAFHIRRIRSGRSKPGLMRQHLTAVDAAAAICSADVDGAAPGATALRFTPGTIRGGDYAFAIGTAGSTTLVLQTVLPALLCANTPSTIDLQGGTHNPLAPPAEFLRDAYLPLLQRMGADVELELQRPGFYPAGGGALRASIHPCPLQPLTLRERGALSGLQALAWTSGIAPSVGERELAIVQRRLGLDAADLQRRTVQPPSGPGNALLLFARHEAVCEVFCGFGARGVSAEAVAERTCEAVRDYLCGSAAVGACLADQLLLPLALAGGGTFTTARITDHLQSNARLIEKFLPVEIDWHESDGCWQVDVRR
nr:RNA 3'-terminal phosphate cyclase [Solimonas marina]